MYVPEWFRITDEETAWAVMREHPFATLVAQTPDGLCGAHLPLVPDDGGSLIGHLAAGNPVAVAAAAGEQLLAVFHGPHAYVSPRFYASSPNVPTWNYVAVHVRGRAVPLTGEDALALLRSTVQAFDPVLESTNPADTDPEFWRKKLAGLTAFRLVPDQIDAKAKLSQNKSEADRESVVRELKDSAEPEDHATARAMEEV